MSNPFADDTMAAGYAAARPPVHARVLEMAREWLDVGRVRAAGDVGCGAGLSTRPLLDLAESCLGFDPAESMVRRARTTAPSATFLVAAGEAIPLAAGSLDLLTAAGSLNYARDLDAVWREAARVLSPSGPFVVYDFSAGRSFEGDDRLDHWFDTFVARYPQPEGQARRLSPSILAELATGFSVVRADEFAMPLRLSRAFYTAYMLTETNVQQAVRGGTPLSDIRGWCDATLPSVFADDERDVVFRGYLTIMRPVR